jgi:hypothetical protein
MAYVQGSSIDKIYEGGLEHQVAIIHNAIQEAFGDMGVKVIATHMDHSFVSDENGRMSKVTYTLKGDKVEDVKIRKSKAVPIIEDEEIPAFVSKRLKSVIEDMMDGKSVSRNRFRELSQLLKEDEDYWLSDVLNRLEESGKDQEWYKMYETNMAQIRTSLYGRLRKIEGIVPKTRYYKLKDKIVDFQEEMNESLEILSKVAKGVVDESKKLVFDSGDGFFGAIQESLIAEAQAIESLLGKAEKLRGVEDASRMALTHDRLAERAKTMAIVSEYLKCQAQND